MARQSKIVVWALNGAGTGTEIVHSNLDWHLNIYGIIW
jgi:hypothetical protein